jgi:uncharacterized protein
MRSLLFALLVMVCTASITSAAPSVEGDWVGKLQAGPTQLTLVVHVTHSHDGSLSATMDSIEQGATGLPVEVFLLDGTSVHFELKSIGGIYDGTMNAEATEIVGTWKQSGLQLPLTLKRVTDLSSTLPKRPQLPVPPFPYVTENVSFPSAEPGVTLDGTLSLPDVEGRYPAVILITGSGPQDRDETVMGHKPFLVIADDLTRKGIAVLRFDDRGVGKSTGDFAAATTADFAKDVEGAIAYLKTRREINAQRIGLIGHSEGGIIAPMVAAQEPDDVAFIVLLAGVGVPIDDLLREQARLLLKAGGASDAFIELNRHTQDRMFDIVRNTPDPAKATPLLHAAADSMLTQMSDAQKNAASSNLETSILMVNSSWFRYLMTYDPVETLRNVKCPVLALNGELDLQVPPSQNLPPIAAALRDGGNRDVETMVIPKLNHLFQTATTGSIDEYTRIEETFSPVALKAISDWIIARVSEKKRPR